MSRVMIIHTGGTLGMRGEPLEPTEFSTDLHESLPELETFAEVEACVACNLDSSDVGPREWKEIVRIIGVERERFDGFVIVHGTDTMAYSASALAFALNGLDRPVIFSGAQRPLAERRSDAKRNLIDAVELATRDIPEVGICLDGLLLRGCRATKSSNRLYRAFESPGCEPLATLGVDVALSSSIRRPNTLFFADGRFEAGVVVVFVTPGMDPDVMRCMMQSPAIKGLVLLTFGLGTAPNREKAFGPVVREAVDRGVDVLVISQALGNVDLARYVNSRALHTAGAINGGLMLPEAAVTKLMHALAVYPDAEDRRRYLMWNVAGELG
ncbi:MAG: hypothetical protein AUK47_22620 [Deltaproteobacteria bacterium CG2_30_63_29]|nr:MAG: hypothetical protein AUK47_22620 [Deltaproteobacteria bacterium CG2_30_63_29]PJB45521.1 MAG: L-asparaginase 1 [Deltaproteobacteria bacterium CG_4_9_14_3_um_filter_63_12]